MFLGCKKLWVDGTNTLSVQDTCWTESVPTGCICPSSICFGTMLHVMRMYHQRHLSIPLYLACWYTSVAKIYRSLNLPYTTNELIDLDIASIKQQLFHYSYPFHADEMKALYHRHIKSVPVYLKSSLFKMYRQ